MPPRSQDHPPIAALALLLLACALVGCATVPMATPEEDRRIKSLVPPADAALVYLYRHETLGYSVHMDVTMDGYPAGQTVAKSFMVWTLAPGRHVLVSKAEEDNTMALDVAAGRRYFVWQEVKMGALYARSKLHLMPDAQGLKEMNECELVKMPRPRPVPPPAAAPPVKETPAAEPGKS